MRVIERVTSRWGRRERAAARDVVRHRSRFGDLVEVADLAIGLDDVGAPSAARHFRATAARLRDDLSTGRDVAAVAYSRRLGDPYHVFEPVDERSRRWNYPRWVLDGTQVYLLLADVVAVGGVLGRYAADRAGRREGRVAARFVHALAAGPGLVVPLPSLPVDQSLGSGSEGAAGPA